MDIVCHGIPRADEHLEEGDIVSIDVTSNLNGWHGDTCATFAIGEVEANRAHVMRVASECCTLGIELAKDGTRLGDLGAAVEAHARAQGCSIVKDVGGHGIGRRMHQAPHIAFFGRPGRGRRLVAGMAITIEPIVVLGRSGDVVVESDGWTMRSRSGEPAAQFEHTILIGRGPARVLTARPAESLRSSATDVNSADF